MKGISFKCQTLSRNHPNWFIFQVNMIVALLSESRSTSVKFFSCQLAIVIQLFSVVIMCGSEINHQHGSTNSIPDTNKQTRAEVKLKNSQSSRLLIGELRNKCAAAERNLDKCSAQLIAFGQETAMYPGSESELESIYCPRFKKVVTCVKDNSGCFKPFERQIINWILTSTRRINFKRCKIEGEKQKFLRLTNSCFPMMKPPTNKCMSDYIARLEAIANYYKFTNRLSANDIQIQLSCCANKRFKQCVMKNAKQHCKPFDELSKFKRTNSISSQTMAHKLVQRVMRDTMDDLKATIEGMSLTGPEFICSNIDENFCRNKFDGRFNGHKAKHRSIVPAMIRIYSST